MSRSPRRKAIKAKRLRKKQRSRAFWQRMLKGLSIGPPLSVLLRQRGLFGQFTIEALDNGAFRHSFTLSHRSTPPIGS